jgi:hypothetical protein
MSPAADRGLIEAAESGTGLGGSAFCLGGKGRLSAAAWKRLIAVLTDRDTQLTIVPAAAAYLRFSRRSHGR